MFIFTEVGIWIIYPNEEWEIDRKEKRKNGKDFVYVKVTERRNVSKKYSEVNLII